MQRHHGFTIIELSIVLVIIGLIVGGIIVGQELVRVAQLRKQVAQLQNILAQINTFRGKYNCIPGDCANATTFFGARAIPTTGVACGSITTRTTATCDGDGDGKVTPSIEDGHFWVHLNAAGLEPGIFDGQWNATPPYNCPPTIIPGACISPTYYWDPGWSDGSRFPQNGNTFELGSNYGNRAIGAWISPIDGQAIDTKMDDGKPGAGKLTSWTPGYSACSFWNGSTHMYTVSTDITCNFNYGPGY